MPPVEIEQLDISLGEDLNLGEVEVGEAVPLIAEQQEPVYPTLNDFMFGEKHIPNQEQPIDLSIAHSQLPVTTPKMIYFDKVNQEQSKQLRDDLKNLYDFGFVEFEINKALLLKHQNVEQVAGVLLEGRLSESVVNQVFKH